MTTGRVVVVGASLAGTRVAQSLRLRGWTGPVTVVGDEAHAPYDRPPLSKQVLSGAWEPERAALLEDGHGLDLRLGVAATGASDDAVQLADGTSLPYDALVVATGARARPLPGAPEDPRVHLLRGLDDAVRLKDAIAAGGSLLVVGGGFIGAEVASTARLAGLDVTVVEALEAPFVRALGVRVGAEVGRLHTEHGTDLRVGTTVTGWAVDADAVTATLSDGTALRVDHVVVGIGSEPLAGWLGVDGPLVCGPTGRVLGRERTWALGDVAAWPGADGVPARSEHWTRVGEQAEAVACDLLGEPAPPAGPPYVWSDLYGTTVQLLGVSTPTATPLAPGLWAYADGPRLLGVAGVGVPRLVARGRKVLARGGSVDDLAGLLG